jgi:hypothetical protein
MRSSTNSLQISKIYTVNGFFFALYLTCSIDQNFSEGYTYKVVMLLRCGKSRHIGCKIAVGQFLEGTGMGLSGHEIGQEFDWMIR